MSMNRAHDYERSSESPATDLGILLVQEEELEVLLSVVQKVQAVRNKEHASFDYIFDLPNSAGADYQCVATLIGPSGPEATGVGGQQLIQRWHPNTMMLVGTALSLHKDIRIGDVVVAEQVDAFLAQVEVVGSGDGGWQFEHCGRVYQVDHGLLQEVTQLRFTHREEFRCWQEASSVRRGEVHTQPEHTRPRQPDRMREEPRLHAIHLASGPVTGAAPAFARWIHQRDSSIKALETGAAGLMAAAMRQSQPVRSLVILGIASVGVEHRKQCDDGDDEPLQTQALQNVIRLLTTLAKVGAFPHSSRIAPSIQGRQDAACVSSRGSPSAQAPRNTDKSAEDIDIKTVLVLTAAPPTHDNLRVDRELNQIRRLHSAGEYRSRYRVEGVTATTLFDLRDSLLRYKPSLLHFSGHGLGEDGLLFEGEADDDYELATSALERLIRLHLDHIECILLNACMSLRQAEALRQYVPMVIGMRFSLSDVAALAFSSGFYQALFHGRNYYESFAHGREVLRERAADDGEAPIFITSAGAAPRT